MVGLAAAILLLVVLPVIIPAASVLRLLILQDTLLKSYCIYAGGKKRERISNSNNDLALGKGLFVETFYKCFFNGDAFNAIKEVNRLM